MVTKAVVPSTLVRAFQRFAVDDSESEAASDSGSSARHGLVLGVVNSCEGDESAVTIWGVVRDLADSDTVLSSVVGGVQAVGSFSVWIRGAASRDDDESTERDAAAQIAKQALTAVAVSSISVSISPQLALVYVHDSEHVHAFTSSTASNTVVPLPLDVVDCAHASDFLSATDSLLLRTSLTFQAETVQEITTWRKELESDDSTNVFFQFPEQRNNIFNVHGVRVDLTPVVSTDHTLLRTLVKIPEKRQAAPTSKSKKKKTAVNDNWDVTSTMKSTPHDFLLGDNDSSSGYLKTLEYGEIADVHVLHSLGFSTSLMGSPAVTLEVSRVRPTPVTVHADALVIVSQSSAVADVISRLRTELLKQLVRLEAQWTLATTSLRSHHFALVGAAFPVTLSAVNPTSSRTTTAMVSLATQFLQPTNQPLFTPASCSLVSNASTLGQMDVLFNVHEGIPSSGVPNGTQYLVDGFYGYYHYLQQSINDKGWGCAYRSLQTLASWLFWNHYTTTPTLSHLQIQETLVAMGDKPPAFLGSREWIGSMEVGFVLDELFGISFRTLNVASGVALVEKAQELKHHFETQGTPVMMGGGQLAFTLLGIDYNASSGECAFLILDPHYVGSEDLEIIQTKMIALEGYKAVPCGWRKAASFSKTSFYNLCLPQRPDTVEHE